MLQRLSSNIEAEICVYGEIAMCEQEILLLGYESYLLLSMHIYGTYTIATG
jgi:hypothetical protein